MGVTVHDYKGRDLYHLIRDNKRYEFRIESLWVEHFNDSQPSAVGIQVLTLNPKVLLPLQVKDNRVSFVLYLDPSETEDPQDLLRSLFSQLSILLWEKVEGDAMAGTYIATEEIHLNNSMMFVDKRRWRAAKLFNTILLVKAVRARLELRPHVLPKVQGSVVIKAQNMSGDVVRSLHGLDKFEEMMGVAFSKGTIGLLMERFGAYSVA